MRGENRVEDTDTPRSEGSRGHAERAHLLLTKLNPPRLLSDIVPRPQIHELLNRLLEHPPRSLHLVVITRRAPPL